MKRFKNILAVYNGAVGADDALSQAAALAHANRARLSVVDTFMPNWNFRAELDERRKRLQRIVDALKHDGLERVSAHVLAGDDAEEIIRRVAKTRHDLVIASVESGSSVMSPFSSTAATRLMRKCPCPVWLLKPGQSAPYGKILAAVDPDPLNPLAEPINVKIMDLATSLARSCNAELHVVHAWQIRGRDRDTMRSEVPDATRAALLQKHEAVHRTRVEALLETYRFPATGPTVHLPRGLPEGEIVRVIAEQGIDLTVMGLAPRSGLLGFLTGNAAETILAEVRGGVLTVKPESLQTPVLQQQELAAA